MGSLTLVKWGLGKSDVGVMTGRNREWAIRD